MHIHLNTTLVKVKLNTKSKNLTHFKYLNTTLVKVKLKAGYGIEAGWGIFKYNSC